MTATLDAPAWQALHDAVEQATGHCAGLLDQLTMPAAPATERWSAVEVGAHLVTVAALARAALPGRPGAHPFPELAERVSHTQLSDIAELNELLLRRYPERDPRSLADALRATVTGVLDDCRGLTPETPVEWFGGLVFPLSAALAHLLNELLIHGHDLAVAAGAPPTVPDAPAAVAFTRFILVVFGSHQDSAPPGPGRRITVEFRSPYTAPVVLAVTGGHFSVEPAGQPVDAHVWFSPGAFMLMLFGRTGVLRTTLTGKVLVWGRRPWRLRTLLNAVSIP
jgi:uncharacterized protein (TIGR03083 family)